MATAPADHPGRWIGGALGALASLALVPIALLLERQPASNSQSGLANMALLGAPIGFVLGRQFFPSARSGGWTMALSVGVAIGWAAPPLGAIEQFVGPLLLRATAGDPWANPTELLFILVIAIPVSFIAAIITVPVGLAWGALVRLVPAGAPARPAPVGASRGPTRCDRRRHGARPCGGAQPDERLMARIAVTGGRGFVGRHLVRRLRADDPGTAFVGCDAVVHCAGINREIGAQTYAAVHVEYTQSVIAAARRARVRRIVMLSFLRARPNCGSGYHESKWAAEELVRASDLDWTVLKAGVIYGLGDHMLDHLSRALQTFPVFGLVGLRSRPVRPVAVDDVVRILAAAALGDPRLQHQTFAVLGPDRLLLSDAVRRVAAVVGRRPLFVPLPIVVQRAVGAIAEILMTVPLISRAQVRILAEGIVEPLPAADGLPVDLLPTTRFDEASIRAGLPPPGGFGCRDLRWCRA